MTQANNDMDLDMMAPTVNKKGQQLPAALSLI
jgi:hypothetical protein